MDTKDIEGTEYIEKSQVDELIRSRLAKMSERARNSETQLSEMKAKLEASSGSAGRLEDMATQLEALQAELSQSNDKYQTHSTITSHGFTDPDVRDMVEWSFSREMSRRPKKSRQKLGEWLHGIKSDPTLAPAPLRPHLTNAAPVADPIPTPDPGAAPLPPPTASNAAAVQVPASVPGRSLIEQALADPEMWKAKQEEIKAAWYGQKGKPGSHRF